MIVKRLALVCDGCDVEFESLSNAAADIRQDAGQQGWRRGPGGDFCADCMQRWAPTRLMYANYARARQGKAGAG